MINPIRNKKNFYHIDFEGIGRENYYGGFTPPGDMDQMYLGRYKDRWWFGEVKMKGAKYSGGQRAYQQALVDDIRRMALLSIYEFEPEELVDDWVKLKNCSVRELYFKPKDAYSGYTINVENLGITPADLNAWADDDKDNTKVKDFIAKWLEENGHDANLSF